VLRCAPEATLDRGALSMFQIDEHVQREIMNHRSLKHPNVVRFKEVSNHF
jgi:hypothetical protein